MRPHFNNQIYPTSIKTHTHYLVSPPHHLLPIQHWLAKKASKTQDTPNQQQHNLFNHTHTHKY